MVCFKEILCEMLASVLPLWGNRLGLMAGAYECLSVMTTGTLHERIETSNRGGVPRKVHNKVEMIYTGPWCLRNTRKTYRRGRQGALALAMTLEPCPGQCPVNRSWLTNRAVCFVDGQFQSEWTTSCLGSCCIQTSGWKDWLKKVKTDQLIWAESHAVIVTAIEELNSSKSPYV